MAATAQKKPVAKAAPKKASERAQKKPAAKAAPKKASEKAQKKPAENAHMKAKKKPASAASAAPKARAGYGTTQHAGRICHLTTPDLAALKCEWREDRDWNSSFGQHTPTFSMWLLSKSWMGTSH